MSDIFELDFSAPQLPAPAGNADRFGGRWRLVGAGLSNVWRYGDLELPAASGRLLLRGPNGTGKTTALEALWPYLLDLNAAKLAAGKARPTTLKLLMSEGAPAKGRRYGYLWLTFAAPHGESDPTAPHQRTPEQQEMSYGVRLQYSPSSTPAVKAIPFTVPGRPLKELNLRATSGSALELEEFSTRVHDAGGQVFADPDSYVDDLARHIWSSTTGELRLLASRLREVRNPTLLGDVSPAAAADALRHSLPGVAEDVLAATAEALAESETTREAFERDEQAATVLEDFARVWTGHVIDVTRTAHNAACEADTTATTYQRRVKKHTALLDAAKTSVEDAQTKAQQFDQDHGKAQAAARAIETSDAYRSHGRAMDLSRRLTSEQNTAASTRTNLQTAAAHARDRTKTSQRALEDIIEDLDDLMGGAEAAGVPPTARDSLLAHHTRPRATYPVADLVIDPGPGLALTHDRAGLDALTASWTTTATQHQAAADKAALILRDHEPVAAADSAAKTAHAIAVAAENAHDEARQALDRVADTARSAAGQALTETAHWMQHNPVLCGQTPTTPTAHDETQPWDTDDLDALTDAEPAAVRDQLNAWGDQALRIGEALAADHEATAQRHLTVATEREGNAAEHRSQARRLRAGQLLPLPRPHWAGPAADDNAFGTLLEWRPTPDLTDEHRALLELALADSGLLGAHLHTGAATASAWQITRQGAVQEPNLTTVLTVHPDHPHAALAQAVLQRVALTDTAAGHPGPAALVIGRDGTFTTGPLAANPAIARQATGSSIPAASHIGARTRLARARAKADQLDAEADQLQAEANIERRSAKELRTLRDTMRRQAQAFPSRHRLTQTEAERTSAAKAAHQRENTALTLRGKANDAAAEHTRLHTDWVARARSLGMPVDPDALTGIVERKEANAKTLTTCANALSSRLLPKVQRILRELPDEAAIAEHLAHLQHEARTAHTTALETKAELDEIDNHDAQGAAHRFQKATQHAKDLHKQLNDAQSLLLDAEMNRAACEKDLDFAQQRYNEARPAQRTTRALLAALLAWPPLASALGIGDTPLPGGPDGPDLDAAAAILGRRPAASRKTLGERYDAVRAELAQTWTIARTDPPEGLDQLETFVLTHAEAPYDPLSAAARAHTLATRARAALDTAEAAALRDFVIGRLPSALGTAWAALTDWRKTVNRKMRAAKASSGVGVQVQITLRDDLDAASRTVHHLSCEVGDAVRTDVQKKQVGEALQALMSAAEGSTMEERLAAAVDIRTWVDVRYLVERAGPDGQPVSSQWGSRTGLSGGERRLVVLAPMLAAIAANYDRFTSTGLRLVPLDEVPAEVDERGREGLARYLAELDLDILCTSYLWDGAPGAWDGIDAHDLEAGPDGTVVAFPMLIRTEQALPGDTVAARHTEEPA